MHRTFLAALESAVAQAAEAWTGLDWDSDTPDPAALEYAIEAYEALDPEEQGPEGEAQWEASRALRKAARLDRDQFCTLDEYREILRLAQDEHEKVEEDARSAAEQGRLALEYVREALAVFGSSPRAVAQRQAAWDRAEESLERACQIEREYGDCPAWRPVLELLQAHRDRVEAIRDAALAAREARQGA